jgi:hypothetical protein
MEEKNESLKIVKKRWNWLRKIIGRNIIDFFQTKNPKKEVESRGHEMSEEEMIEEIHAEASAYGLASEVEEWAKKEMKKDPTLPKIDAYVRAYNAWVK